MLHAYKRLGICRSFSKVSFFAPIIWNTQVFEFRCLAPGAKTIVVSAIPEWLLRFLLGKRGPHSVTVPPPKDFQEESLFAFPFFFPHCSIVPNLILRCINCFNTMSCFSVSLIEHQLVCFPLGSA